MRHHKHSEGRSIGPVRRFFRGIFFLAAAPVFIAVGLIMLPFALIARAFGFRGPMGKFGKHGCRGRRGASDSQTKTFTDAGAAA